MTRTVIVTALLAAALLGLSAKANAAAERCPAEVPETMSPVGAPRGSAAKEYAYEFQASSTRTISGSVVADTDKGWYVWDFSAIPLVKASQVDPHNPKRKYTRVASTALAVIFPVDLIVRHAWVAHAKTQDETFFGWDAQGDYECDVPAFASASQYDPVVPRKSKTQMTPAPTPNPTPAPLASPQATAAVARAAAAPFAVGVCDNPFVPATVIRAQSPEFPRDVHVTKTVPVLAEVTIDPDGNLVDAWMYESSGNAEIDAATLRSARMSTYSPAISYCRKVNGTYIFRADFTP